MIEIDTLPAAHQALLQTLPHRDDMILIAAVNTRDKIAEVTIHALRKDDTTLSIAQAINAGKYPGSYHTLDDMVHGYTVYRNNQRIMRPARVTWRHVTWHDDENQKHLAWARTNITYDNHCGIPGQLGKPCRVGYNLKTVECSLQDHALKITDPRISSIVASMHMTYENLDENFDVPYVYAYATTEQLCWLGFNRANHPSLGCNMLSFDEDKKLFSVAVMPRKVTSYTPPETISCDRALQIWERIAAFGSDISTICAGMNIPDISAILGRKPLIEENLDILQVDAVMGPHLAVLKPTYQRLGIVFDN